VTAGIKAQARLSVGDAAHVRAHTAVTGDVTFTVKIHMHVAHRYRTNLAASKRQPSRKGEPSRFFLPVALACMPAQGRTCRLSNRPTHKIFTARAASNATIINEISDCSIVPSFAHRDSTAVSVGENAVLVLNARNK
jgi:hypothetical protein